MSQPNRRTIVRALAAALPTLICAGRGLAREVRDLTWEELLPEGETSAPRLFGNLIDHDAPPMSNAQPVSGGVRLDLDGQIVRLSGFIVPIEFRGTGVSAFILVPYVGACVHVPPPPANQLIFVTTPTPYEGSTLFDPVNVTGKLGISSITTELAQVGYSMAAELIEPF